MSNTQRYLIVLATLFAFLAVTGAAVAQPPEQELLPKLHFDLGEEGDVEFKDEFQGYEGDSAFGLDAAPGDPIRSVPGCQTAFLDNNFSSRGGVIPRILVLHYTVSPNVEGPGDVNAIRSFFNNDGTNASSTYVIDFEGNCRYIVNESMKPWTQTFYNPWSISVEIIATGRESKEAWLTKGLPGLKKTAAVFAGAAKRHNIPIRYVNPGSACVAPAAGITDHEALDCQNSHTDVRPNFPYTRFLELVKAAAAPPPVKVQFVLADGEGTVLARSTPVLPGGQAEADRYKAFVNNTVGLAVGELRKDLDIRILRRKVEG